MEEGWAQLVLPTKEEAAEYFARFRTPSSLNPDSTIVDEEIVQGMVDELHMVMKSVRFSAATIVSPLPFSNLSLVLLGENKLLFTHVPQSINCI